MTVYHLALTILNIHLITSTDGGSKKMINECIIILQIISFWNQALFRTSKHLDGKKQKLLRVCKARHMRLFEICWFRNVQNNKFNKLMNFQ